MPFRRWSFALFFITTRFSFCNRSGTLRRLSRSIRRSPRYGLLAATAIPVWLTCVYVARQTIVVLLPTWLLASSRKPWRISKWYVVSRHGGWHPMSLIRCHRYPSVHRVIRMQRWSWMNAQRLSSVLNLKRPLKYVYIHTYIALYSCQFF